MDRGGLKFIRPYHVDNSSRITLDIPLLEALLRLPVGELKERIDEAVCSGLMKPDTHLGENARHIEVSDDQATSYLYP